MCSAVIIVSATFSSVFAILCKLPLTMTAETIPNRRQLVPASQTAALSELHWMIPRGLRGLEGGGAREGEEHQGSGF